MAGDGDLLPVSARCRSTARSRPARPGTRSASIAQEIPIWDPDICIDCGKCAIVCPHATIRMKVYDPAALAGAPDGFKPSRSARRTCPGMAMTIQVAPDDCTGCGVCVDVCPAKSKSEVRHKAINMEPAAAHREHRARSLGLLPGAPRDRPRRCCPTIGQGLPGARSRCSSSPAPAPAAARRRTSSSSPSCSATA